VLTKPFLPFVTLDLNTESVVMDIQGSDTKPLAEQKRFELLQAVTPLAVFKTAPFSHLGTAPDFYRIARLPSFPYGGRFWEEKNPISLGRFFSNGGCYRARTYDLLHVKQMLSQLS
jgi:hypothetical protein